MEKRVFFLLSLQFVSSSGATSPGSFILAVMAVCEVDRSGFTIFMIPGLIKTPQT